MVFFALGLRLSVCFVIIRLQIYRLGSQLGLLSMHNINQNN